MVFRETGLRFEADVCEARKPGFFLDQRENRRQWNRWPPDGRCSMPSASRAASRSMRRGAAPVRYRPGHQRHALAAPGETFGSTNPAGGPRRCRHDCTGGRFRVAGDNSRAQYLNWSSWTRPRLQTGNRARRGDSRLRRLAGLDRRMLPGHSCGVLVFGPRDSGGIFRRCPAGRGSYRAFFENCGPPVTRLTTPRPSRKRNT